MIEKLGLVLHHFNTACNLLYRQSAAGKAHPWVAPLLDAGKPPELIALARHDKVKGQIAAVIRPDLILTDDAFALSELDSVPGGIGLTAFLNRLYDGVRGEGPPRWSSFGPGDNKLKRVDKGR